MKPNILLTAYQSGHLNSELMDALTEHFSVIVKAVRRRANKQSDQSIVVSKKTLIAGEAGFLLQLCASLRLYRGSWIFASQGGHYSTLLFARMLRVIHIQRPVFLLNFYLHDLGQNRWVRLILRWLLTKDVYVIAQATSDADYFRVFLPAENVLYQPYCQGPLQLGSYDGRRGDFVFSGGWTNRDYDALFRCAARLPDIEFVVAASGQSVITAKQPPNVRLLMDCDSMTFHRTMAESRFVVLPLKKDVGSSGQMVLLAAMQLGKTAIVSNIGAVKDYVDDGVTGLFCRLGDDDDLTKLINDSYRGATAALDAIGRAAQQRYAEQFTPDRYARSVADFVYASGFSDG